MSRNPVDTHLGASFLQMLMAVLISLVMDPLLVSFQLRARIPTVVWLSLVTFKNVTCHSGKVVYHVVQCDKDGDCIALRCMRFQWALIVLPWLRIYSCFVMKGTL